jgi:DNA-binding response OmpR family regulator
MTASVGTVARRPRRARRGSDQRWSPALKPPPSYIYDDGDLVVRPDHFVVLAHGELLELPRRVLFLLLELARHPGVIRTRAELGDAAWGARARRIKPQSIDHAISRLRHSLSDAMPELEYVHTHAGLGYRFERESRADDALGATR